MTAGLLLRSMALAGYCGLLSRIEIVERPWYDGASGFIFTLLIIHTRSRYLVMYTWYLVCSLSIWHTWLHGFRMKYSRFIGRDAGEV